MTAAATETLRRIHDAIMTRGWSAGTHPHPGPFTGYPATLPPGDDSLIEQFGRRLEALTGKMYRPSDADEAARLVVGIAQAAQAPRVLCWDEAWVPCPGLRRALGAAGIEVSGVDLPADSPARGERLARAGDVLVGVTGALAAIADTGTIVLANGAGRSRMASLLPPVHVALVSQRVLYPTLPSFLEAHADLVALASNVVLVTGPSRTADIEMALTHGVHGPREVHVMVIP